MAGKRIGFAISRPGLASSEIRGREIARALGYEFFNYDLETAKTFDIIIYVKLLPAVEQVQKLHQLGKCQLLDVIDNYNMKRLLAYKPFLQGLIAANLTHEIFLSGYFEVPIKAIPHHHRNINQIQTPFRAGTMPTIGYVGHEDHWSSNKFVTKLDFPLFREFDFSDLETSYQKIDIGFAYRKNPEKARFNSGLKLLNFMSFGIPSVLTPESAFLEVANHGEECLFADTKEDFLLAIEYLAKNPEVRKQMGERAFLKAKAFHISKIITHYQSFLKQFL